MAKKLAIIIHAFHSQIIMFAVLLLVAVCTLKSSARTVDVRVEAPWSQFALSTPVAISEFLYDERSNREPHSYFWDYIEELCNVSDDIETFLDDQRRNSDPGAQAIENSGDSIGRLAMFAAEKLLSRYNSTDLTKSLLQSALTSGMYLPSIHMFHQVIFQCFLFCFFEIALFCFEIYT